MRRLTQYVTGTLIAVTLFSYVLLGNFSGLTLSGPLSLEPNLESLDGPGFIASPAVHTLITGGLFLLSAWFFCSIPNLASGLRRHWRTLVLQVLGVYVLFAFLAGDGLWFLHKESFGSTGRIASLVLFFGLLCFRYDNARKTFSTPARPHSAALFLSFAGLLLLNSGLMTLIFSSAAWLDQTGFYYVLLRLGILSSALTGAFAVLAKSNNS